MLGKLPAFEILTGSDTGRIFAKSIPVAIVKPLALRDIGDPGAVTSIVKCQAHGILHDEAVQFLVAIDPVVAPIALLPQTSRYFAPMIYRRRWWAAPP